ncbi:alcohol dehydrogenase [Rhizoctonia solani 123E]|uniref:Alcohol dehydrogenase n=1 Tax=Rhizoctonia solani 123E TaxID=1423351 RepID=A0A074RMD8_9AGAM|nr:alcohol dehydrogenase [Rhizoctonia solani 123E]
MAPITNGSANFNEAPERFVNENTIAYSTSSIDIEKVELNGGILAKTLYLSIDPHLRRWMDNGDTSTGPGYELGKPIWGIGLATVLRSEKDGVGQGDIVYVPTYPFLEYSILGVDTPLRVIHPEPGISLSAYLNVLGMPGQTAFYGLELIGNLKAGETIYVSAGAGAVGSLVAQLAKAKGLKVIASAGSNDKVEAMKRMGVDVAFNYKTADVADVLAKEGPIDIYWDHIGGPQLEAAIGACNLYARIIVCGALLAFNGAPSYHVKNLVDILYKRLRVQGFMYWEAEAEVEGHSGNPMKFINTLTPLVKSGEIRWSEQVFNGIKSTNQAIVTALTGANIGKVVVKVAEPSHAKND